MLEFSGQGDLLLDVITIGFVVLSKEAWTCKGGTTPVQVDELVKTLMSACLVRKAANKPKNGRLKSDLAGQVA